MNLIKETWRIENNPIKWYLILNLLITIFFIILLIIFIIALASFDYDAELLFNSTNLSQLSSNSIIYSSNSVINFNLLASTVVLLGGFGGFCYIFFSICDGSISNKEEISYGLSGFLIIILFIDFFYLNNMSLKASDLEPAIIIFFSISAVMLAILFRPVSLMIKENYNNRTSIINFLEKNETEPVTGNSFSSISRIIVKNFDFIKNYTFVLIILIFIFGILMDFNILSITSAILFCLLILNVYSQLSLLTKFSVNIELKKQNHSIISSQINHSSYETLKDVFILNYGKDFLTILKNEDNEIVDISKYCICSIKNNEYEIFNEKEFINIIFKTVIFFCIIFMINVIVLIALLLFILKQNWNLPLSLTQLNIVSIMISFIFIYVIREKIGNYIDKLSI